MPHPIRSLAWLLVACIHTTAIAGTVIDIEAPGINTRLMMDERFARVDNAADGSYLLHDRRKQQSYLVLPGTQQVMQLEASGAQQDTDIRLVPKPASEARIFGYPTQRYQLFADREYCGDVFASKQAMKHLDVGPMLQAVSRLVDKQMDAMGPYIVIIDRCTQASMRVLEHSEDIGMPLRIHDSKGRLLSDIVNIDVDADIEQGLLAYPSEYTLVDSVKELSPTQQVLKSARQYSPQLDNAFRTIERFMQPQTQVARPEQQPPAPRYRQPPPHRYQQPPPPHYR